MNTSKDRYSPHLSGQPVTVFNHSYSKFPPPPPLYLIRVSLIPVCVHCSWPSLLPHVQRVVHQDPHAGHQEVPVIPIPQPVQTSLNSSHALSQPINWLLNLEEPYHPLTQPESCQFGEKETTGDRIKGFAKVKDI